MRLRVHTNNTIGSYVITAILLVSSTVPATAQKLSSVEICGVPFALGMSRHEMMAKLTMRRWSAEALSVFAGEWVPINYAVFALPETESCHGELHFTGDRVDQVQKTITSTSDAVALVRLLFLELRNISGQKEAIGTVTTWQNAAKDKDIDMFVQGIIFRFGEHLIQLRVDEGRLADKNFSPSTILSVGVSR